MRAILIAVFLLVSVAMSAQDTIYLKNGQKIPATILEKNETEIRYKKADQPQSAAVYSVFTSDILSIHYQDGIVADYTQTGQNASEKKDERPIDNAGTMKSIRWSAGFSLDHFERKMENDLLVFWRDKTSNPKEIIEGNPVSIPVLLRMNMVLGNSGRNRLGDELQIIITPADAIYAYDATTRSEIKLRNFYYNISIYYGHTLNHRQTVIGIIEPGLDFGMMSGHITLNNVRYDLSLSSGVGFHQAAGFDWLISRRFMFSGRAGYRFLRMKESHENPGSSTGYSSFYVEPGVSDDLLSVRWNGPYFSLGLSYSFYTRLKFGNQQ